MVGARIPAYIVVYIYATVSQQTLCVCSRVRPPRRVRAPHPVHRRLRRDGCRPGPSRPAGTAGARYATSSDRHVTSHYITLHRITAKRTGCVCRHRHRCVVTRHRYRCVVTGTGVSSTVPVCRHRYRYVVTGTGVSSPVPVCRQRRSPPRRTYNCQTSQRQNEGEAQSEVKTRLVLRTANRETTSHVVRRSQINGDPHGRRRNIARC